MKARKCLIYAHEIVRKGWLCVPKEEGHEMTIKENLEAGAHLYTKDKQLIEENMERVFSLFPVLKAREKQAY